ncbi:MAG: Pilus assembly protein PilM [Candidatus Saccharibacteria bacterium]|nr:Pilus assembly protein PilM [Candidatus Saccharibacteria bacterium]
MNSALFYKDKPLFGLDIGFNTIKVMQLNRHTNQYVVSGYGVGSFDAKAIENGVVVDYESMAKSANELFDHKIIGEINTRRVAVSVPAARTFNRPMTLPVQAAKDLDEAVRLEAEQYIPVPLDDLYIDYVINNRSEKEIGLLAVASPRKMIDSYLTLMNVLGLEPVTMETTIGATGRLFLQTDQSDTPTVLIDFGSISADITIYDKGLIVTGTVPCGGDNFTDAISTFLGVTKDEAHIIKTKYGLGPSKKQADIKAALAPQLEQLVKEIRRMIRYYEDRSGKNGTINQIVTMGGGANMPGLSEYMTNTLRLPVRTCDPWERLTFGRLQPPSSVEQSMYVTVAGLALIDSKEIFK